MEYISDSGGAIFSRDGFRSIGRIQIPPFLTLLHNCIITELNALSINARFYVTPTWAIPVSDTWAQYLFPIVFLK